MKSAALEILAFLTLACIAVVLLGLVDTEAADRAISAWRSGMGG